MRELIDAVSRSPAAPTDSELRAMARTAAARPRSLEATAARRRARLARSRWILVAVVAALLAGSGLGFGLAGAFTPRGSATSLVGFGFLPAQGWNVMQSGTLDATGVARAIAANVSLDPGDDLEGPPRATLASLPARGVVVLAIFRPRGDPEEDFRFPMRELPLRLVDADPTWSDPVSSDHLARYLLRAGVRGYNVDVRVYLGTSDPSAQALASAQRQLNRLLVAADRVTLVARPTIVNRTLNAPPVTLFGSVSSGKAGETVEIQAKDCGSQSFRVVAGATTESGGSYSTRYWPGITTTLRAVWNDSASDQVTIRQRVGLDLRKIGPGRRFRVIAAAKRSVWLKRVQIQRFNRRLGTWSTFKSLVLDDSLGSSGVLSGAAANFSVSLPRGTVIRVFMPRAQVGPCYLPGFSQSVRT